MTRKKILIVDDEPSMRLLLSELLSLDYEIAGEASNGNQAVEMYKELKPDLVTLDEIMPEMDGLNALKEILAFDPQAKVIIITALDHVDNVKTLVKAGALDYIIKPFDSDKVLDSIQKALK